MTIAEVVSVTITSTSVFPQLPNFGEPLIACYTNAITTRTAEYSSLAGMVAAGFLITDPAYLSASKIWSQNPSVPFIKIGRRVLPFTQILQLTTLSTSTADTYSFSVGGLPVTLVSTGVVNADAATLTTAITALGITGLTATNPGSPSPNIRLTMTAGKMVDVIPDVVRMSFADQSTAGAAGASLTTDLNAIQAFDSNWYFLLLDNNSPIEITTAAAWTEVSATNGTHLFLGNGTDTLVKSASPGTDNSSAAYVLNNLAYTRSSYLHSQSQVMSFSAAAWVGKQATAVPGSDTWAFKTLAGVTPDNLTDTEISNIEAKKANVYTTMAGLNLTRAGTVGQGGYLDVQRFLDWFAASIQVAILGAFANNAKVPYTDAGMDVIRSAMNGVFQTAINNGGLAATPAPIINIPLVANQLQADRAARIVRNITFTAQLAGAAHKCIISGVVNP
jgi:hypothetical protein